MLLQSRNDRTVNGRELIPDCRRFQAQHRLTCQPPQQHLATEHRKRPKPVADSIVNTGTASAFPAVAAE